MINIAEVWIANGTGILLMVFFLVPCMTGIAIQWAFYGIAVGWLALSISLLFVYILFQSEKLYVLLLRRVYEMRIWMIFL